MSTKQKVTFYTVQKFPFHLSTKIEILMVVGADILRVAMEDDRPTLWALMDLRRKRVKRYLRAYCDEQSLDSYSELSYVGSIHASGSLWHIFDAGDREVEE